MWPSDPSGLLSEEKQKELRTLSSQATACEEKTLWSQIKEESQEVTNTSSEKKQNVGKGHSSKMEERAKQLCQTPQFRGK